MYLHHRLAGEFQAGRYGGIHYLAERAQIVFGNPPEEPELYFGNDRKIVQQFEDGFDLVVAGWRVVYIGDDTGKNLAVAKLYNGALAYNGLIANAVGIR